MKRIPSPSMAVAITALVFALAGSGYAATQLTSHGSTAKAAAKKKRRRGPAGPQGAAGATGQNGVPGAPGAPGAQGLAGASVFTGRVNALNTAMNTAFYGAPTGTSVANGLQVPVQHLSPAIPLVATTLSVKIDAAPGGSAIRFFNVTKNGTDSPGCAILSGQTSCSITLNNFTIQPLSDFAIRSEVAVADAAPANARFAWTAQ